MRAVAVAALALILAACGGTALAPRATAPVASLAPAHDRLFVAGPRGTSVVDVASGKVERELPPGILSGDRSVCWTASHAGATTVARRLGPATGAELGLIAVPGAYELPRAYVPLADALAVHLAAGRGRCARAGVSRSIWRWRPPLLSL